MAKNTMNRGFFPSETQQAVEDLGQLKERNSRIIRQISRKQPAAPPDNEQTDSFKAPHFAANSVFNDVAPRKKTGKEVCYYLSYEVINAVNQAANHKNTTPSRIVDKALRHVFMI